ncbi:pilus assembly FimT family protein [Pseudanabaena mucicola]|uniref:Prepilin-type N-terminal cleavage/methylation domain-containing protein n=1 Tax=Pseudanabaena mucicola FACHB-723 TaxID=2692860 RepID=A0ABR8A0R8_9CYAN|nr:prepilin-type N-terminal cleavage/methylation domain-containing protein [Pseudanabaena mucicola]MBD2188952.1 prepilin-type N-terminal cleavage/methylation domain-containing protein [Pseudanabaena mucicola FACHB-723]
MKRNRKQRDRYSLGFTLIEVLVVMIIVGILSAIAAPSWLGFVNNQRINSSQTKIFQAIKVAQSDAKVRKVNNATGRTKITFTFPASGDPTFKLDNVRANSGQEQRLESGVIIASVTKGNITANPADPPPPANVLPSPVAIEFDSRGFLVDGSNLPICINLSNDTTANKKAKKWIKIQTILGAVTTGAVESEQSICGKT